MKKCLAFFFAAFLGVSAGVLAASFVQITRVSDSTMLPSYEEGDHVVVIKASGAAWGLTEYGAGDVVLLENPVFAETGEDLTMMKRVIGIPGDRVEIEGGAVYVNGEAIDESAYIFAENTSGEMKARNVPGDGVFVLGDNRAGSTDSRSRTVGIVKINNILGKVIYKW